MVRGHGEAEGAPRPARLVLALLAGLVAWSVHFLAVYGLAGSACAFGWDDARLFAFALADVLAVAATVLAAGVAAGAALYGWRVMKRLRIPALEEGEGASAPFDPKARTRLLAQLTVVLGAISFVAILAETVPVLALPVCA